MSKKNIVISNLQYHYSRDYIYLPYIYGVLRAYCDEIPALVEAYNWGEPLYDLPPDYSLNALHALIDAMDKPAVLGISCYIWNFKKQLLLAQEVKKKFPNCLVVAGGPQIPADGEALLREHPAVDLLVHGEGEKIFSNILLEFREPHPNWQNVRGLSFLDSNKNYVTTSPEDRLTSLDLPSPYLAGYFDELIQYLKSQKQKIVAMWETNRGCPYSCTFCNWGAATMTRLRRIPEERVLQEIDWFADKQIEFVRSSDGNFGIFEFDETIVDKLIETKAVTGYPQVFWVAYAKSSPDRVYRITEKMSRSQLSSNGATISLQSTNKNVLNAIKRKNLKDDDYAKFMARFDEQNLPYYCEMIVGLPGETRASFIDGLYSLFEFGMHEAITLFACEIFPSTEMASPHYRAKYGIQTVSRPYYKYPLEKEPWAEMTEVVVGTNTMPTADWIETMAASSLLQALHCGGWTRFISQYLRREQELSYKKFYDTLFAFIKSSPSKLGDVYRELHSLYTDIATNSDSRYTGWRRLQVKFNGAEHTVSGWPYATSWIQLCLARDQVIQEIKGFLAEQLPDLSTPESLAVLEYTRQLILTPDYNPHRGKMADFGYDFYSYFHRRQPLIKTAITVHFNDQGIGPNGLNPFYQDLEPFFRAVTGGEFIRPHSFVHQPRAMRAYQITSHESSLFT